MRVIELTKRREHHKAILGLSKRRIIIEIGTRDLFTMLHDVGFGALFMLAFTAAMAESYRVTAPGAPVVPGTGAQRMLRSYLTGVVWLGWLTFTLAAFLVAGVTGAFGVFVGKYEPIRGAATIHLKTVA